MADVAAVSKRLDVSSIAGGFLPGVAVTAVAYEFPELVRKKTRRFWTAITMRFWKIDRCAAIRTWLASSALPFLENTV